jgi:hypothetical protein
MLRYALSTKLYKIRILLFFQMLSNVISFYTPKVPPNLYILIVSDYILLEDWGALSSLRMLNTEGQNFYFSWHDSPQFF